MTEQTGDHGQLRPIPIGSRVFVPAGPSFDAVRRALAAIDAVHGDGDLPAIPVVRTRAVTEAGAYEWSARTGDPLRLRFSPTRDHPELTVVHEIGHFLDHQIFGRPGTFASQHGAIPGVMRAISRSESVTRLRALRNRRRVIVEVRGRRQEEVIKQQEVIYLLETPELFARAYAQFISHESGDQTLERQLVADRGSIRGRVYHHLWMAADFEPIADEFRRLLGRRRWMTSR